jgi:ribonuclease HII
MISIFHDYNDNIIYLMSLLPYHTEGIIEVGIDEAGRGPIFGRVYAGAVIWPNNLVNPLVKDSKKYTKTSEREQAYDFIVENAIAYGVAYVEPEDIDKTNIYKAVITAMHNAIKNTQINPQHILVDGNSFKPFSDQQGNFTNFTTVVEGDNKYYSIAAASVLAKVSHDRYIVDLCNRYPMLEKYDLRNNMGYGTANHMAAIKEHGITQFHRQSFKCCKNLPMQYL